MGLDGAPPVPGPCVEPLTLTRPADVPATFLLSSPPAAVRPSSLAAVRHQVSTSGWQYSTSKTRHCTPYKVVSEPCII